MAWSTAGRRVVLTRRAGVESFESRLLLAATPRQMEYLDRGVVATQVSASQIFVGWRSLAQDAAGTGFNVYRSLNGGTAVKLNASPLTAGTNYTDSGVTRSATNRYTYFVKSVLNGVEQATDGAYTVPANTASGPMIQIPLRAIGDYSIRHMSVADLTGDGKYDYIVGRYSNESAGYELAAKPQVIEAYGSDGAFLWAIDCGPNSLDVDNIEPGAPAIDIGNWDGVTSYDLDGDGFAEVLYRSAHGVTFGDGKTLSYPTNNNIQFISVIDGRTGAERARVQLPTDFLIDGPLAASFAVGYLDGVRPSLVAKMKNRVGDGVFNQMFVAYDYNGTAITQRWKYITEGVDSDNGHNIRMVDVDGDGKDELADTAQVIDDDGTLLYNMRLGTPSVGHGDRFFIGDLDPDRPGLEGYGVQQNNANFMTEYYYDAATGEVLHSHYLTSINDNGRGSLGDIDPNYRGYEYWSFYGLYNSNTPVVGQPPVETKLGDNRPYPNFRVWWDGDVGSENLNDTVIDKWNPATQSTGRVSTLYHFGSPTSTSGEAPVFYGDIVGDWREEVIFEKYDHTAINIYSTQIASSTRLYTLTQNPEYRNSITAKGYLQSNMVDYYLGYGMATPPTPNIQVLNSGKAAPSVLTPAAATPVPVTGTTVNLSVLGTDDGGEAALTYAWAVAGPGGVTYSANGTNAAKNTTATLSAAGKYIFTVTLTDAGGKTALGNVTVIVNQTATRLTLTPAAARIGTNSTQQLVATAYDQFDAKLATQPGVVWGVLGGGGAVDANGVYTPPPVAGAAVVTATAGPLSATATITFSGSTLAAPTSLAAAAVSGSQINLTWADTVVGESGFVIDLSTDGTTFTPLATTAANATGYNVTGLNGNATYDFRVRSLNAAGTGVPSAAVSATTHVLPLAWWKLDESAGTTAVDATGNLHDATTRNGPTWTSGRTGNGLAFDGTNDAVELHNDLFTTAAGSVSLWVKTNTNFSSYAVLFYMASDTYGNGFGSQSELHLNFTSAEKLQFYVRGSASGQWSNDVTLTSAASYADNAWHHVVATWQAGGNAVLYVDGVAVASQAFSPVFTFGNTQRTFLSRTANGTNPFKGAMDDVRVYGTPLTAAQAQRLATPNAAPTVVTPANSAVINSTSSTLSVLGADDAGAAALTYTWTLLGVPPAAVGLSANGTNAAKTTTATFTTAGVYDFLVTITDAAGLSATSWVSVTVADAVAPALVSAVSRKAAGRDVPIVLNAASPPVENRVGGPDTIVMTFSEPVVPLDGTLSANEFNLTNAQFVSASISGVTLTLRLTNIANAARVSVTPQGLVDVAGNALVASGGLTVRTLAGDADRNGTVNFNDFLALQTAFGMTSTGVLNADFDANGAVDFNDFLLLQTGFGSVIA